MATKPISQKKWVKGLAPGVGILTQTPASLQRVSNLLLTQRGSLQTCDGSLTIGQVNSSWPTILNMGVFNNYASGAYPFYPTLHTDSSGHMRLSVGYPGSPAIPLNYTLVTDSSATWSVPAYQPALLAPGDPQFSLVGTTTNRNPTPTSGSLSITAPTPPTFITIGSWTSFALVTGDTVELLINNYANVFSGTGSVDFSYSLDGGATYTSFFTDTIGQSGTIGTLLPAFANLNTLILKITVTATTGTISTTVSGVVAIVTTSPTLSPYGGVTGQAELIPQILQFTSTTILILGNGLPPETIDVTLLGAATAHPLTNTFTANYPSWQASVQWLAGNQISVIIGGTAYLFTATQGGLSGSSTPAFSAVFGSTVTDDQVIWRNSGVVSTSPNPRGAAHGIVYAGSLWLANTSPKTTADGLDGPTVLKMSDANNPNSWNPLNVAFLGRDDGTQITGLASFTIAEAGIAPTGSLCVFKEFSTFQVFGVFGATDFQITQAQTDLGCIAARTIQFLPGFGITRLTHLGFAIFDGVRDKLISEEIRPYLFGGTIEQADIIGVDFSFAWFAKGTQSTVPPMYFCAAPLLGAGGLMTRVFCYDLVLKAWVIIDLPWPISALSSIRVGEGKPLLLGGRSDNGKINRLQSGDTQWDSGTVSAAAPTWSAQMNDVFLEGSSQRAFFRALIIRGQVLDPTIPPTISVSMTFDGITSNGTAFFTDYFIEPQPGSNQFQLDVDLMVNAQIAHIAITGTGRLLIDSIDWEAQPKKGKKVIG